MKPTKRLIPLGEVDSDGVLVNPPWPTTAKSGATWGPYKLDADGWWRLDSWHRTQDREFARVTAAKWKQEKDNSIYAQWRTVHRERLRENGRWYVKQGYLFAST